MKPIKNHEDIRNYAKYILGQFDYSLYFEKWLMRNKNASNVDILKELIEWLKELEENAASAKERDKNE